MISGSLFHDKADKHNRRISRARKADLCVAARLALLWRGTHRIPRFPFGLKVSVRSKTPFKGDRFMKLAWRAKQNPGANPSKLQSPSQSKAQHHLPSSHIGRATKRDPPEGGLFDTISSVSRRRTAQRFEGFHGRITIGSACPLVSIANSR